MNKTIAALVAIVILAVGGYFVFHKNPNGSPKPVTSQSNTTTNTTPNPSVAATITYNGSGFQPDSITVKSGDTVAIKNTSSSDMQLDSNPHPIHTDDTDLNAGTVSAGQTVTFTVTKKGTFGFHNHLNPSQTGSITIQ